MPMRLFVLLFLAGHVFAKEPPDVDCLVIHLKYVHCSWNKQGTPEVNYTFFAGFSGQPVSECPTYLSENNTNTGCNHPHGDRLNKFSAFYTKLVHGNQSRQQEHKLKDKVKLNPPTNLTVHYGSDSNLWFSWEQDFSSCVKSEVRYRINKKKWAPISQIRPGVKTYCINLPSDSSLYEMQVRSKFDFSCGDSIYWSDWTSPVSWGSNNSTETNQKDSSMSVWTTVLYVLGAFLLILLVMLLLHHERIRIIFIPVVPKPSKNFDNVEVWPKLHKGLKESINYNERPCTVREYCHVPQSDSDSSDCSTCSVTTDQTDCSINIPVNKLDPSTPCSSSTSTVSSGETDEEKQICV
ncbi:cytokine receptor common subunit gamma-like [Centropristis striata]|uniref:cytokine receptor common subunit gamma-like n=1 Tax=Centropristis striata TaxID=184440 RepID=UPI0027E183B9|nr:cytokine receptor common subunit gamma-like [Centropristis striata]